MVNFASEFYSSRKGNCAQAIAAAWNEKNTERTFDIELFKTSGHGKAPDGLCGALHAACLIAGDVSKEALCNNFAQKTEGHLLCRDIRSSRVVSCHECVSIAASLLAQSVKENKTEMSVL